MGLSARTPGGHCWVCGDMIWLWAAAHLREIAVGIVTLLLALLLALSVGGWVDKK